MKRKIIVLGVFLCLFSIFPMYSQNIQLNFCPNSASTPTGWNEISNTVAGSEYSNLLDEQESSTSVGLTIVDLWSGNGTIAYASTLFPDQVGNTYFYTNGSCTISFTGLDPSISYDFVFYASRSYQTDRLTQYTINGVSRSLQAGENSTDTVTISGVQTSTGELDLEITTLESYGHLNGIIIIPGSTVSASPVADAGNYSSVQDTDGDNLESITLDGSGSYDPDGTIQTWIWTEDGTTIGDTETCTAEFTVGTHEVTLTVTDDEGNQDSDVATIIVLSNSTNQAPQADAGTDQTLSAGTTEYQLNGSNSTDADGDALTYSWTQASGNTVTITSDTTATPTISGLEDGNLYAFELTVSDGTDSDVATVSIYVQSEESGSTYWQSGSGGIYYDQSVGNNIGLGTTTPQALLHIASSSNTEALLETGDAQVSSLRLGENNSGYIYGGRIQYDGSTNKFHIQTGNNNGGDYYSNRITILRDSGYVGIGTTAPEVMLSVNGKIKAEGLDIVTDVPASDYVFDADYQLMTLPELNDFIKKNKHLPEIPSAEEFKENGYSVGEMDDLLLRKVEELTLYILLQEEKIKELERELKDLKQSL